MNFVDHLSEVLNPLKGRPLARMGRTMFFVGLILLAIISKVYYAVFDKNNLILRVISIILIIWITTIWYTKRHIDIYPSAKTKMILLNFLTFFVVENIIVMMSADTIMSHYLTNTMNDVIGIAIALLSMLFIRLVIFLFYLFKKGFEHRKKELQELLKEIQ